MTVIFKVASTTLAPPAKTTGFGSLVSQFFISLQTLHAVSQIQTHDVLNSWHEPWLAESSRMLCCSSVSLIIVVLLKSTIRALK